MSEALFIFTLLAATRRLAGWLVRGGTRDLVASGVWLALAYAARNEAAMAALLTSVVVVVVSYSRSSGTAHQRRLSALTDGVIVAAPFALSFVGWAATSWIIVGHPFEQFSSVYGTSSQLKLIEKAQHGRAAMYSVHGALAAILAFAPLLPARRGGSHHPRHTGPRAPPPGRAGGRGRGAVLRDRRLYLRDDQRRRALLHLRHPADRAARRHCGPPRAQDRRRSTRGADQRETGVRPRYLDVRRRQRRLLSAIAGVCRRGCSHPRHVHASTTRCSTR